MLDKCVEEDPALVEAAGVGGTGDAGEAAEEEMEG